MKLPEDKNKLLKLLRQLQHSVEDILLSGMTSASSATCANLNIACREASRLRLLRLGSTLRVASQEISRFNKNDDSFSLKRLSFFLNRAWMLSRGMIMAIEKEDEKNWRTLTWNPSSEPSTTPLELIAIGVSKRFVPGVFCAFEFRLRNLHETPQLKAGEPLIYSSVFPIKPGSDISAEAFLYLIQKQKFKAADLLKRKIIKIEKAAIIDGSQKRLLLTDQSLVRFGNEFQDWEAFQNWDQMKAAERLKSHKPGPFDLDIELQEEVVLHDWDLGEVEKKARDKMLYYPIYSQGKTFYAQVAEDDTELNKNLKALKKSYEKPPLFAIMHYENCRMILQPLSIFEEEGPKQLTVSDKTVGAAELLRSMKF